MTGCGHLVSKLLVSSIWPLAPSLLVPSTLTISALQPSIRSLPRAVKQPSRPPFRNAKLVESFRGEMRAPLPLHPMEKALVFVACLHLCFLPWAFGARDPWAQLTSAGLGLVSFVLAMLPRRYSGDLAPQGAFVLHPWSRALKFPIFWLGLLFLGYIACQAINPAYIRATAGVYWWLAPVNHIEWLPSGVEAPFERMNAWRMLAICSGSWTLSCALFVGLTRRISVNAILATFVINGGVLALLGILQKVTGAKGVFWVVTSAPNYFTSTFYYKNHAGAYFNLVLISAVSFMVWHYFRALRRMERSSPAPVYAFVVILLAAVVFLSNSRTAMMLLTGYTVAAAGLLVVLRARAKHEATHPAAAGLFAVCAVMVMIAAAWFLNLDKSVEQIRYVISAEGQKNHLESRILAREATLDLFEARPINGWGAGSFRHIFPITQRNYPEIYNVVRHGNQMMVWDHAHNDYAQALAEVGVAGCLILASMLTWLFVKALRLGALVNLPHLLLLIGFCLPLSHAWLDFPLYNCAILTTFCATAILLIRWMEVEAR